MEESSVSPGTAVTPEWVRVLPDYTNLTVSYKGYQTMMIAILVILVMIIVVVGVVGWYLSATFQQVKPFDPYKVARRIRDRPETEPVETTGPDLSESVVLYRGSLPTTGWWHAQGRASDYVDAPIGKCSYVSFVIEGMINPRSHTVVYSTMPFGESEGRKVLEMHRSGHRLNKGWGVNTFPSRRGVWCMPFPNRVSNVHG